MSDPAANVLGEYAARLHSKVACETARYYVADVRQHLEWLAKHGLEIDRVTADDLRGYIDCLMDEERPLRAGYVGRYAISTVARKVSALREFYMSLHESGRIASNPAAKLKPPAVRAKRCVPRLSPDVSVQRLSAFDTSTARRIRDQAIIALATLEGLKVGEICKMNVADVDLEAGIVHVSRRCEKQTTVYLSKLACQALTRWLAVRRLLHNGKDDAVFISMHWTAGRSVPGGRISKRGLHQVLCEYRHLLSNHIPSETRPPAIPSQTRAT